MSRLLGALAQSPGAQPALASGPQRLDRGSLLAAAERLAANLGRGSSPVAVALPNGISWLVADLALLIAGRASIPVPAWFGAAQLAHIARTTGAGAYIGTQPPPLPHGRAHPLEGGLACWPLQPGDVALPDATVKVTFTSGTTGAPKGVCLSLAALEGVAIALAQIGAELGIRRHLCVLPLPVLLENIGGAWAALLAGAECVVPPLESLGLDGTTGIDPRRLLGAVAAASPDSLILVPGLLEALVIALEHGGPRPASLRFVAVGGAPTPLALLARAERVGLPVYQGYGLSECASVVTLNRPGDNVPGTCGRPMPHLAVSLAADGEVLVDGPPMLGYAGDATPVPRPWRSGDLGSLDPYGRLRIIGRKRNVFITALGRNISPEWLEAELVDGGPIRQAVVYGEGMLSPAAVVAAAPGAAGRIGPWIASLNARLPGHARITRWVAATEEFSHHNGLCTPNGRPVRRAVWARYGAALQSSPPLEILNPEMT